MSAGVGVRVREWKCTTDMKSWTDSRFGNRLHKSWWKRRHYLDHTMELSHWPWWMLRRWLKWFTWRIHLGSFCTEMCQRCGRCQPLVWWADDEIWQIVSGVTGPSRGGAYCPECFDCLFKRKTGILLSWAPEIHEARIERWDKWRAENK